MSVLDWIVWLYKKHKAITKWLRQRKIQYHIWRHGSVKAIRRWYMSPYDIGHHWDFFIVCSCGKEWEVEYEELTKAQKKECVKD